MPGMSSEMGAVAVVDTVRLSLREKASVSTAGSKIPLHDWHQALPSRLVKSAQKCAGARQVFGLAGILLTYSPQLPSRRRPVLESWLSFLLTAAGQSRISTGFPFHFSKEDRLPDQYTVFF
jgi:hypothetical protein